MRGTDASAGGDLELAVGVVFVIECDRLKRFDGYDPEDRSG